MKKYLTKGEVQLVTIFMAKDEAEANAELKIVLEDFVERMNKEHGDMKFSVGSFVTSTELPERLS